MVVADGDGTNNYKIWCCLETVQLIPLLFLEVCRVCNTRQIRRICSECAASVQSVPHPVLVCGVSLRRICYNLQ